jgi:ankyrin repeat protein
MPFQCGRKRRMFESMSNRRTFLATLGAGSIGLAPAQTPTPSGATNPNMDIFQAAAKGDISRATEMAKLNPAIALLRSPDGRTALHYATAAGQTAMVFFLTTQGADLSAGPESPLLAAVDYPDHALALEMSQALLMNASDPDAKRSDGRSAAQLAAARGYTDVVELLAHRGASDPVTLAIRTERVHFAQRYRFDVAGRPYAPENLDGLPRDFINEFVRLAHFDVDRVKHLAKLAPGLIGARATWDECAIEAAAHMGLAPLVRHLADLGAPVSTCTAALLGLRERVEALLQSDAGCVRERGAHDISILAYTAYAGQHSEIADLLLRSGASVEGKALGVTTLHLAASKGYLELAEVLLQHGADVNAQANSRGQLVTPLAAGIRAKQDKMAEFLKSRGGRT